MEERLRVMIVDDEILIRSLIRMRVDWDALGMEIVAEASGAGDALALLDEVRPDIIFTDICMPAIDGIEFSRMVIERNPSIRIVVVTGHDEFEYAKSCIKIGVSDFLLKPLRAEELTQTATALRDRIREERNASRDMDHLRRRQTDLRPTLQENALLCLLTGCGDQDAALKGLRETDTFPMSDTGSFQTAVVEVEPVASGECEETIQRELASKAMSLVRKTFRADDGLFVLADGPKRIAVVNGNGSLDLDACGEVLLTQLLNGCHCYVTIGTGTRVDRLDSLSDSYRDACRAVSGKVVFGRNRVIRSGDAHPFLATDGGERTGRLDRLSLLLSAGLADKARSLMESSFFQLLPADSRCLPLLRQEALDIILVCGKVGRMQNPEGDALPEGNPQLIESVLEIDNLPDMRIFLGNLLDQVAAQCATKQRVSTDPLIERVLAFIRENLGDGSLTLSGTAAAFYVSPSHLSRLFRRKTGRSFVDYVTRERMAQAFEYVTQSDMKSHEIGKRIGIDDPHYFSILFKKHTGMSVCECRKR